MDGEQATETDRVWALLVSSNPEIATNDPDPEYKRALVRGYNLGKHKTYSFRTLEEEESYFAIFCRRRDLLITPS